MCKVQTVEHTEWSMQEVSFDIGALHANLLSLMTQRCGLLHRGKAGAKACPRFQVREQSLVDFGVW